MHSFQFNHHKVCSKVSPNLISCYNDDTFNNLLISPNLKINNCSSMHNFVLQQLLGVIWKIQNHKPDFMVFLFRTPPRLQNGRSHAVKMA